MGLDMYLKRKHYVKNWDHTADEHRYLITVTQGGVVDPNIDPTKICEVVEEVGYWRKANAIHNWFVQNIQKGIDECQESYVEPNDLKELLQLCREIMDHNELAPDMLPVTSGFFFGSTEYDEWYFQDIEDTIKILEEVLAMEGYGELYYRSSW